ncbi:MAG: mechanosensitive ion channel family protein [Prochloraceae cyanobacterium]
MLSLTRVNFWFNSKSTRLKRRSLQLVLLGLALVLLQTSITAAPSVKNPLAPPDTSSPQATLRSFVKNVNKAAPLLMGAYEQYLQEQRLLASISVREQIKEGLLLLNRANDCLNLSEIPPRLKRDIGVEGVILLKEILDRIEMPPDAEIPDAEAVAADDELTRWRLPQTTIDLVEVDSGVREGEFLFSSQTVAQLEEFYQRVKTLPYKPGATEGFFKFWFYTPGRLNFLLPYNFFPLLPSWMKVVYGEQALWQWIGLGFCLFVTFWIPYRSFLSKWGRVNRFESPEPNWSKLWPFIITLASLAIGTLFIDYWLNIGRELLLKLLTTLDIIFWIVATITIFHFGNALAESIIASTLVKSQSISASALRTFFRLLSLIIGIIILIVELEHIGISLIPILAGLGFGGLALALASRPTLENVIAGLLLFADRPVKVGEYCRFGGQEGTILNIGLRSTRIFALNGDIISLPNSHFSELELVNKSRRKRILLRQTVGLRYKTTSEQLRYVLVKLRSMLLAHPKLLQESARVRFVKYGDYSKDVEIFAYVNTGQWTEFLGIQEDVLLRVNDIVEAAGTDFAFPSQTTYLSRDSGLDSERSRMAEAEVQAWRSKGMLPFPEFPPEQSEQLRNTLDFPPKGSPSARPDSGNEKNSQEK